MACGAEPAWRARIEAAAEQVDHLDRRQSWPTAVIAAVAAAAPALGVAAVVAVTGAAGPGLSGPALGVVVLLPLAVLELVGPLAGAGDALARVEASAARVRALLDRPDPRRRARRSRAGADRWRPGAASGLGGVAWRTGAGDGDRPVGGRGRAGGRHRPERLGEVHRGRALGGVPPAGQRHLRGGGPSEHGGGLGPRARGGHLVLPGSRGSPTRPWPTTCASPASMPPTTSSGRRSPSSTSMRGPGASPTACRPASSATPRR